jgi:hypothetical protein
MLLVFFVLYLATLYTAPRPAVAGQSPGCSERELAAEIKSDSPVYPDANELAKTLVAGGFVVKCMLHSTMQGMFEGMSGDVLYRTDRGDFVALFMAKPKSFESLEIIEKLEKSRYIYSFRGNPQPRGENRIVDSSRPEYFIKHANQLLIIWGDSQLAESLRRVLGSS